MSTLDCRAVKCAWLWAALLALIVAGCSSETRQFEIGERIAGVAGPSVKHILLPPGPVEQRLLFLEGSQIVEYDVETGEHRVIEHWVDLHGDQCARDVRTVFQEPGGRLVVYRARTTSAFQRALVVLDMVNDVEWTVGHRDPWLLTFLDEGRLLMLLDDFTGLGRMGRLVAYDLQEGERRPIDVEVHRPSRLQAPDPLGRRLVYRKQTEGHIGRFQVSVWDSETGENVCYGGPFSTEVYGFSPDGRMLAYSFWVLDEDGEESQNRLALVETETGEERLFGDRIRDVVFDGLGGAIVEDTHQVLRVDLTTFETEVLATGLARVSFRSFAERRPGLGLAGTAFLTSHEGTKVLVFLQRDDGDVDELLIDLSTGARRLLGPSRPPTSSSWWRDADDYVFSPDGRYLGRVVRDGPVSIVRVDGEEGWRELAPLSSSRTENIHLDFSADGRFLAFTARAEPDASAELLLYEPATDVLRAINRKVSGGGCGRAFVFQGRHLLYKRTYGTRREPGPDPRGIYAYELPR